MADPLQHNGSVRGAAVIGCVVGGLSGCFYFESINQRPSVQIVNDSGEAVTRNGAPVMLHAVADDPERDPMKFAWSAYACVDATELETCDAEPFATALTDTFTFDVINMRREAPLITENVLVTLTAEDQHGAQAKPQAELIIPIVDLEPMLAMSKRSRYSFNDSVIAGTPVEIFAKVTDDDDGPRVLSLAWTKDPPQGGAETDADLVDASVPFIDDSDGVFRQYAKIFTPQTTGEWNVLVHVTDPLGNAADGSVTVNVVGDHAPCLAQLAPTVPPPGNALPLSQPTLFRVPRVNDDLDPYPLIPNDPIFRATTFRWSLKGPGQSTHAAIAGASGNSFALDPASYAPGDIVELRVQIYDRKATVIPCADGEATCSTISDAACLQRQTWRVEIR